MAQMGLPTTHETPGSACSSKLGLVAHELMPVSHPALGRWEEHQKLGGRRKGSGGKYTAQLETIKYKRQRGSRSAWATYQAPVQLENWKS